MLSGTLPQTGLGNAGGTAIQLRYQHRTTAGLEGSKGPSVLKPCGSSKVRTYELGYWCELAHAGAVA